MGMSEIHLSESGRNPTGFPSEFAFPAGGRTTRVRHMLLRVGFFFVVDTFRSAAVPVCLLDNLCAGWHVEDDSFGVWS